MKSLVWTGGLVLFLILTSLAFVFTPFPGSGAAASAEDSDGSSERSQVVEELRRGVESAVEALEEHIEARISSVEVELCALDFAPAVTLCREWEVNASAREAVESRLAELLAALRAQTKLDFILAVLPGERLVGARRDAAIAARSAQERDREVVRELTAPFPRGLECRAAIEALPRSVTALPSASAEPDAERAPEAAPRSHPCVVASRPIRVRPDAPCALVVGGVALERVIEESLAGAASDQGLGLEWHVFSVAGGDLPVISAGSRKGALVRRGLVRDLESRTASERAAFTQAGPQVGRWRGVRSAAGKLVGGWGLTVSQAVLDRSLAASSAASEIPQAGSAPGVLLDRVVATSIVLISIVVLWVLLALWARYVRPQPGGSPAASARALGAARAASGGQRDAVERFQESCRRFLRRLEELLGERLRAAGVQPEELAAEVKKRFTGVAERIDAFADEFAGRAPASKARRAGPQGFEEKFRDLEETLKSFVSVIESRFGERLRGRTATEAERIEAEYRARLDELCREVDSARAQGRELVRELEALRTAEQSLRTQVDTAGAVELDLRQKLEETHLRGEQLALQENAAVRRLQDVEAQAREDREAVGKLKRRATELEKSLSEARDRVENLERELAAATARNSAAAENTNAQARSGHDTAIESPDAAGDRADFLRLYEELDAMRHEVDWEVGLRKEIERASSKLEARVEELQREVVALREEAEGLQAFQGALIAGNLPVAMGAVDTRGKVFVWNPASEHLWKLPAAAALGETLDALETGSLELRDRVLKEIDACVRGRRPTATQVLSFRDGEDRELHVRILCEPILDGRGEPIGAIFGLEDRTEATAKSIACELQGEFQDTLTSSIPMALVVVDPQHRVVTWNRHAADILGVEEGAALNRELLSLPTRLAGAGFRESFLAACRERRFGRFVARAAHGDSGLEYLVTVSPFVSEEGRFRGWLLLVEEVVAETV
jgi:PAS domain-containing protein